MSGTFLYEYIRLYTDDKGETHFGEGKITLKGESFMGGPPVLIAELALANGAKPQLAHIPAGSSYDWHNTVARQFIFVVQGYVDFTVSDGSVREVSPGSLILFEDLTGKGHRTRAKGPDDHIALVIPLEQQQ
ncbi:MAG: cupin domain-containing protein [Alphaproteobacteria bacterium]